MIISTWPTTLILISYVCYALGYRPLGVHSLNKLRALSVPDRLNITGSLLSPLLVPRVSGTPGNTRVREFIVNHFQQLGWHVELDSFVDYTPMGPTKFTNIIVTKNPNSDHHLVMGAHFDSKYYPDFEFIGATDSAVPCAILMDVATTMNDLLDQQPPKQKSLQLIFFDGEEAVREWSSTDSIYDTWENTVFDSSQQIRRGNRLDQIELLVLLDLLGTPNPSINNYYRDTNRLFYRLLSLEKRLLANSLLATVAEDGTELRPVFNPKSSMTFRGEMIGDDHTPFLQRGVEVLHIIPFPFPSVWHNPGDMSECIDPNVVLNFAVIFRAFVAEYLEIDPLVHTEL
ncbi:hypothetical protein J3Q64DRAFT_1836778 [Phycomyces blakesleeanus]|uniref:Peptide hydrolase n=1 Tax=Phycomyces blakesleeanus TaxID=4837 RepID=A0ABR3AWD9_PHYBL